MAEKTFSEKWSINYRLEFHEWIKNSALSNSFVCLLINSAYSASHWFSRGWLWCRFQSARVSNDKRSLTRQKRPNKSDKSWKPTKHGVISEISRKWASRGMCPTLRSMKSLKNWNWSQKGLGFSYSKANLFRSGILSHTFCWEWKQDLWECTIVDPV